MHVPVACPGVPAEVLDARKSWKDPDLYDRQAHALALMFDKNFKENASDAAAEVKLAGPKI